ncbi:MAG: hypothetical protein IK095_09280, partial [Oscillospiraceae bacterium]|nr:hypothetical protein [Oscillospiraceae bacterium]
MKKILWIGALLLCALAVFFGLRRSARIRQEHIEQEALSRQAELAAVTELTLVVDEEGLSALEQYPNLQRLDLSGSSCYDAIDAFADEHPQIAVAYTLPLGPAVCRSDTESLELLDEQFDASLLLQALPHLRRLESLELRLTELDGETLDALAAAVPQASFRYSRRFLDWELPGDAVEMDLSILEMDRLRPALPVLASLPHLETLRLMREDGSSPFSLEEALEIHDAVPNAFLDYRFTLFGRSVSTGDTSLYYLDTYIGDEGLPLLRQALSIMPRCEVVTLDDCWTSDEATAALRDELARRTKIVWRVHYGIFSDLTDTKIIHAVADEHHTRIDDEMCEVLRYCTETEYMDLGHDPLTSIEFCRYMPHLKMAILSYNDFSDLSPLADHEELIFLEIFSCRRLVDVSPLA